MGQQIEFYAHFFNLSHITLQLEGEPPTSYSLKKQLFSVSVLPVQLYLKKTK